MLACSRSIRGIYRRLASCEPNFCYTGLNKHFGHLPKKQKIIKEADSNERKHICQGCVCQPGKFHQQREDLPMVLDPHPPPACSTTSHHIMIFFTPTTTMLGMQPTPKMKNAVGLTLHRRLHFSVRDIRKYVWV
jgi:hypothetical protein